MFALAASGTHTNKTYTQAHTQTYTCIYRERDSHKQAIFMLKSGAFQDNKKQFNPRNLLVFTAAQLFNLFSLELLQFKHISGMFCAAKKM